MVNYSSGPSGQFLADLVFSNPLMTQIPTKNTTTPIIETTSHADTKVQILSHHLVVLKGLQSQSKVVKTTPQAIHKALEARYNRKLPLFQLSDGKRI